MSYPILYNATETNFDHNGVGILSACVSCEVTEEANGIFELAMQYPMDGIHFEDIASRTIIKAKADQFREPQLFRVYAISKPMSGIVTVFAEHISYDLSGIPVSPFSVKNVALALSGLKANAAIDCPFTFWTDKTTVADFSVPTPASIRSMLGGSQGSILDVYSGEYEFDNYTVKLYNNRGMNRGVSICYGKNLTDIKQEENCSSVITGVYPFWKDVEGETVVELPEKIVNAPGTYNFRRIKTLDLSEKYEEQPSVEQIRSAAESYVKNNAVGVPKISMSVSFAQLEQSEEYKGLKLLDRVSLFDTVNVEFPALKVSATAKAVKIVYDSLAERVKTVTLGNVRANIADTIAEQIVEVEKKSNKSFLQIAIESLTKTILGAKGGSVRFLDTNEDGEPDTLYIADDPDPAKAVKVWRFNYEGWGASQNGYNGPFELGASLKDGIVADFITAGTLYGILFKAGAIESVDGKIQIDLSGGLMPIFNTGIQTNNEIVVMNESGGFPLFKVGRYANEKGKEYFDISGFEGEYNNIFRVSTGFDENGDVASTLLEVKDGDSTCSLLAFPYNPQIYMRGNAGAFELGVNENWYGAYMILPNDTPKVLSWKANDDGTYTLIGQEPT